MHESIAIQLQVWTGRTWMGPKCRQLSTFHGIYLRLRPTEVIKVFFKVPFYPLKVLQQTLARLLVWQIPIMRPSSSILGEIPVGRVSICL